MLTLAPRQRRLRMPKLKMLPLKMCWLQLPVLLKPGMPPLSPEPPLLNPAVMELPSRMDWPVLLVRRLLEPEMGMLPESRSLRKKQQSLRMQPVLQVKRKTPDRRVPA